MTLGGWSPEFSTEVSYDVISDVLSCSESTASRMYWQLAGPADALHRGMVEFKKRSGRAIIPTHYVSLLNNSTTVRREIQDAFSCSSGGLILVDACDKLEDPSIDGIISEKIHNWIKSGNKFVGASRFPLNSLNLSNGIGSLIENNEIQVRKWPTSSVMPLDSNTFLFDGLISAFADLTCSGDDNELPRKLALAAMEVIERNRVLEEDGDDSERVIDPVSGLELPPAPRTPFSGRSSKYGTKISVEEFVEKEWGDYAQHGLLYSEFIRGIDNGLYKACYYQAKLAGKSSAEYMLGLGILSKEHLLTPPVGLERQARLLQRLRLRGAARRFEKMATKLEPGIR